MELVLGVVFVPLEVLAKSLVEDNVLLKLSACIITKVPGVVVSNPNLADRLQVFIELQQVSELVSTSSNYELAHDAQKCVFTLMMVRKVLHLAFRAWIKTSDSVDVLNAKKHFIFGKDAWICTVHTHAKLLRADYPFVSFILQMADEPVFKD